MPTLQKIAGELGGSVTAAGVDTLHAVSADNRIFVVGHEANRALKECGIVPPPPGKAYSLPELDKALASLSPERRIAVKLALRGVGLLRG